MASGAAQMAALSKRIESIPDAAVQELVRWFVPRSEEIGGTFRLYGHDKRLSSRVRTRSSRGKVANTLLGGTPATGWSIKSFGRRGQYDVRPRRALALKLSSFSGGAYFERVHVSRATTGDNRWQQLVDEASTKFPTVVAELVDSAVMR